VRAQSWEIGSWIPLFLTETRKKEILMVKTRAWRDGATCLDAISKAAMQLVPTIASGPIIHGCQVTSRTVEFARVDDNQGFRELLVNRERKEAGGPDSGGTVEEQEQESSFKKG
jgi:hypothetical protein